ncbi:MAG: PleD family two-component system response regulator [Candidatus Hydrothermarchaeales archaeon]
MCVEEGEKSRGPDKPNELPQEGEEKPRAMIVSNDKKTRKLVKGALKEGYEVIEAEDGKGCVETLQDERPDLVLLDEEMEEEDGWGVLEEIKATVFDHSYLKSLSLPIVMISGSPPSPELLQRTELERLVDYITKPLSKEDISSRVDKIMKRLSRIEKTERRVRSMSKNLADEYLKISKAMYLRRGLVKSLKEDLKRKREADEFEDIFDLENAINDQTALINFYKNRRLEIEEIIDKRSKQI